MMFIGEVIVIFFYLQISEMLICEIGVGWLEDGVCLLLECVFVVWFNMIVCMLCKVLLEFEKKGFLECIQGFGNYVCSKDQVFSIYLMLCLELYEGGGLLMVQFFFVDEFKKFFDLLDFGCKGWGI